MHVEATSAHGIFTSQVPDSSGSFVVNIYVEIDLNKLYISDMNLLGYAQAQNMV